MEATSNLPALAHEPKFHYRFSKDFQKMLEDLLKAHKEIKHAERDAENGHFNNSYSTIESIIDASKSALNNNNIMVFQFPSKNVLTTRLQHTCGEFVECDLELKLTKDDMQGLSSAITYGRRISLSAMLNMAQTDDDGNAASGKTKSTTPKTVIRPAKESKSNSEF